MEAKRLFKCRVSLLLCLAIVLSCFAGLGAVVSAAEGDGSCDLVVTAITTEPANPKPGDQVTFCATVKNNGSGASPAGVIHGVRFSVGELESGDYTWNDVHTQSIPAGGSVVLKATGGTNSATWSAKEGNTTVYAWVDDQARINETNTGNNVFSTEITVSNSSSGNTNGKADLTVTEVSPVEEDVYDGDYVKLYAIVRNTGTADAVNPTVSFASGGNGVQTVKYEGTIRAGEQKTVTTSGYWNAFWGTSKLMAYANSDKAIEESKYDNDTCKQNFAVIDGVNPNPKPTTTSKATTKATTTVPPTTEPPVTGDAKVVAYPQQAGLDAANEYKMTANGVNITMFKTTCNNTRTWNTNPPTSKIPVGMFDFSGGAVTVKVTFPSNVSNVVVRPTDKGIKSTTSGNTVTFTITQAGQYSVEPNGDGTQAVLVFANPEEAKPSGNVTYVEGLQTQNPTVSNTLYLAPGATLRGSVKIASGGTVCGRGVIDGSTYKNFHNGDGIRLQIETWEANNVNLKGICLLDSNAWVCQIQNSSNVTIDNVKILSARANSDGISIQSSNNVKIKNCFIRSWDDSIVVKNYSNSMYSHDITAENCVLWTDLAQSIELGFETNKASGANPTIYNCTFTNMYVIHANHKAPISIHNGDNCKIYDIKFNNVYIDDCQTGQGDGWNLVVDITNLTGSQIGGSSSWTHVQERGHISNVTIDGLYVRGGKTPRMRFDSSTGGSITGVTVKDYYLFGEKKTSAGAANADIKSASVSFQ